MRGRKADFVEGKGDKAEKDITIEQTGTSTDLALRVKAMFSSRFDRAKDDTASKDDSDTNRDAPSSNIEPGDTASHKKKRDDQKRKPQSLGKSVSSHETRQGGRSKLQRKQSDPKRNTSKSSNTRKRSRSLDMVHIGLGDADSCDESGSNTFNFDGEPTLLVGGDYYANIARVEERIRSLQNQTLDEIQAMKHEADTEKEMVASRIASELEAKSPVDAILLLHKLLVNHFHASSRGLTKQMASLQKSMLKEVSKSGSLSRDSIDLQNRIAATMAQIRFLEDDISFHQKELEECEREFRCLSMLNAEQHGDNSKIFHGFDGYTQDEQIPLFQKWQEVSASATAETSSRNEMALIQSYELPKSSVFHDVLSDPDCRLNYFTT